MSEAVDLLRQDSHFAFGKNWASYAQLITEAEIAEAIASLRRLVGDDLTGKRFLDLGCGSGLHALAALRLGAASVVAVDIDPDSVCTTRAVLHAHAPGAPWTVLELSVFDAKAESLGRFDVVYSWGVLHHTGDMYRALRLAASLVAPGGRFVFALYYLTWMCWFWKIEKRWYASARERSQSLVRAVYVALYRLAKAGKFAVFVKNYRSARGMDFYHDVHDWLGGWPYESVSAADVDRFMQQLGLRRAHLFGVRGRRLGLLGSGCNEYVYKKPLERIDPCVE
jgi:2-polyprenyl-6-hydroxyphenyl methylase/3-demethylubiquinone-9 3-methyltransferase